MLKPKFSPAKNRVLVLRDAPKDMFDGTKILQSHLSKKLKPELTGEIVAQGKFTDYPQYEIGDRVIWVANHNGVEMNIDGNDCLLLHIENVLGKFTA